MTQALVVVDVQNDFAHPEGSLSLDGAKDAIKYINLLQAGYDHVIYTKDYHPEETDHFLQWPAHCVADTWGAEFHEDLEVLSRGYLIYKGTGRDEDGYSGFYVEDTKNKESKETELDSLLQELGVEEVHVVGLALDVCVRDTAFDAHAKGYKTVVIKDATAPVTPEYGKQAVEELEHAGVIVR